MVFKSEDGIWIKNFLILDSTKVCHIENRALRFFSQHADENDVEHAMIFSYVCVWTLQTPRSLAVVTNKHDNFIHWLFEGSSLDVFFSNIQMLNKHFPNFFNMEPENHPWEKDNFIFFVPR